MLSNHKIVKQKRKGRKKAHKRWDNYTKKWDNHYDMVTHLEPDILEWEIKWAMGSTTQTKLTEVTEF